MGFFGYRYKVVFVDNQGTHEESHYIWVKAKKVKAGTNSIIYKKKPYFYDLANCSYTKRLTRHIFVELKTGDTVTFARVKANLSPEQLAALNVSELVKLAVKSAVSNNFNLVMFIVVFVAGVAVGCIVGQNFLAGAA